MTARNETPSALPVLLQADPLPREQRSYAPSAAFSAQALGQGGERRGLKGGAPVLEAARGAYLRAQWSGEDDRRPAAGLFRRTRV